MFNPVNDPANPNVRTLTWAEAAIGAMATTPCPCGELEIGREATRVCMGNFSTPGMWGEPDYSSCEFTEKAWRLCDAVQVSVASYNLSFTLCSCICLYVKIGITTTRVKPRYKCIILYEKSK